MAYGTEIGYYTNNGDELTAALGQSYRFDNKDNPFTQGSGLSEKSSDIVGAIGASFANNRHNLNYRFQINGQDLYAERHELYASTKLNKTHLSTVYLFAKGSRGSEFENSREQVYGRMGQAINDNWSVSTAALYDMGYDPGLREHKAGVSYDDDCFGVSVDYDRNLQRDASGAKDTSIFVRLRLKNLGEFKTSAYEFSSGENEE
jgi:LPS-assembly protein